MTNPLQKRKRNQPSLNNPHSRTQYRSNAQKSRSVVRANPLLARHWDHSLSTSENYKKLGFAKKLNLDLGVQNKAKRGVKRKRGSNAAEADEEDQNEATALGQPGDVVANDAAVGEMKVIRGKNGKILRLVQESSQGSVVTKEKQQNKKATEAQKTWKRSKLRDIMSEGAVSEDESEEGSDSTHARQDEYRLVEQLEKHAAKDSVGPTAASVKKMSPREKAWCAAMVARHSVAGGGKDGKTVRCDWDAMCRDRKMNVMQLSRGQMRDKIRRYLMKQKIEVDKDLD